MLAKFYMIDDNMYYFGGSDDGSMKTGSQTVKDNTGDSYKFYFYTKDTYGYKKGAGVVGNQSNKLYYYGLLLTADDYKYQVATVENHDFIINSNGSIQHSFDTSYKEDGDTLITVEAKGAAAYEEDGQYKYGFTKGVTSKEEKDLLFTWLDVVDYS